MSKGNARVSVEVRNGDINRALKIFKKRTFDSGHLLELRDRKEYTKPKVVRRKQKMDAIRREKWENLKDKIESGNTELKLPTKKVKKK